MVLIFETWYFFAHRLKIDVITITSITVYILFFMLLFLGNSMLRGALLLIIIVDTDILYIFEQCTNLYIQFIYDKLYFFCSKCSIKIMIFLQVKIKESTWVCKSYCKKRKKNIRNRKKRYVKNFFLFNCIQAIEVTLWIYQPLNIILCIDAYNNA